MNVLRRLNRDLGADFDLQSFRHEAVWVPEASRIEMHLVSTMAQTVTIAGETLSFATDERIITEHCHKYTPMLFAAQAGAAAGRPARPGPTSTTTSTFSTSNTT